MREKSVDIPQMKRELLRAGWKKVAASVWQAPCGALFRGPFDAWRRMKHAEVLERAEELRGGK